MDDCHVQVSQQFQSFMGETRDPVAAALLVLASQLRMASQTIQVTDSDGKINVVLSGYVLPS